MSESSAIDLQDLVQINSNATQKLTISLLVLNFLLICFIVFEELTVPFDDQIFFMTLTFSFFLSFVGLILVFSRNSYSPKQQVLIHNYIQKGARIFFIICFYLLLLSITIYITMYILQWDSTSFNSAFEFIYADVLKLDKYIVIFFIFATLLLIDFSSVKKTFVNFNKKINYILIIGSYSISVLIMLFI